MRCRVQKIHDALSVVWGEISRLEDETDRLESCHPVTDEREARIAELEEMLRNADTARECAFRELNGLLKEHRVLQNSLSTEIAKAELGEFARAELVKTKAVLVKTNSELAEAKKALAFYENLAAKQATGCLDKYMIFGDGCLHQYYLSLEDAKKALAEAGEDRPYRIARLVWV